MTDPRTSALDPNHKTAPPAMTAEIMETRLANDFDLVRVRAPVYIQDKKAAAARSAGAERVAKHRAKQLIEGLRPAAVPAAVLDQVKAAGGWAEWEAQKIAAATPPPQVLEVEKLVEKRVEVPGPERVIEKRVEVQVPAKLSTQDLEALSLGRAVQQLGGWRKALARFALGDAATQSK